LLEWTWPATASIPTPVPETLASIEAISRRENRQTDPA
jgi:hypothetical protein